MQKQKISWSQMIQTCLILREWQKKIGGSGGTYRVFFLNIREICPKSKLLPFITIGLR